MPNIPVERTSSRYRTAWAVVIVLLSIVIPQTLFACVALAEMRDKGVAGAPSRHKKHYYGSVKNGELWCAEVPLSSSISAPPIESRVVCLNLETGTKRETGLTIQGENGHPLWIGETLYFVTHAASIYRETEGQFVKLGNLPPPDSRLFEWQGQLTTITSTDDEGGTWLTGSGLMVDRSKCHLLVESGTTIRNEAERSCCQSHPSSRCQTVAIRQQ